jgi:uncharacterized protein YndB with AHSA1/START domain
MDEVSTHVDAPPERVWAIVTDIERMGEWSPECTGGKWLRGATGPAVGATFRGTNKRGLLRWFTHCKVAEADQPRHFAFDVRENGARWGYRFEPDAGGTTLTEYHEQRKPLPRYLKPVYALNLLGRDRDNIVLDGMRQTIERMKAAAEA